MTTPHVFIFLGRSGSGKGTQLELLKKYIGEIDQAHNIFDFTMGDAYRSFFKTGSYVAEIAKEITNKGYFQPDFLTISLFVSYMANHIPKDNHIMIDGFPRSVGQLQSVLELVSYTHLPKPIFIDIDVSEEEVKRRMLGRGRADDTDYAIEKRLSEYTKIVVPLVEKIQNDTSFVYWRIDGNRSIEDIHKDIISRLVSIEN